MDKVFYNKSSADSLGWTPQWFNSSHHDDLLVVAIKEWQKKNGLKGDGLCGPTTYRRIWTEREADIGKFINKCPPKKEQSFIICNSSPVIINWPKVVLWDELDGLKANAGTYYNNSGDPGRQVNMFVNHWDVCLSSSSCAKVLNNRGVSVHFCLDNDGTIYQMLDTQHAAWHAGVAKVNKLSIGVEISNAYYPKYQDWYKKNGHGERPLIEDAKVNNSTLEPFLGFYEIQIQALKELWRACATAYDIPLVTLESSSDNFKTSIKTEPKAANGSFNGFVSHYHITKRKIDCAGLDIAKLLKE
ncbi:MAG: N-acetylmuramoyl-L-alanine amidase [Rhodobacteraceae bacterium]|nr:N-acetylmuramoyl-L-alanine amidase [Paracoccaceae bacterium]